MVAWGRLGTRHGAGAADGGGTIPSGGASSRAMRGSSTLFRPCRVTRHPPGWDAWLSPEAQLPAVRNDRGEPLEPDHHSRRDWSPPERPMLASENRANAPGREIEGSRAQRR